MKKTNLYMDLHVLQTVPPSCVNRDDTGSPKTTLLRIMMTLSAYGSGYMPWHLRLICRK